MHSPLRILALLVLALLATSAVAWKPINQKDTGICADKNQDAAQAIAAFCQRFPMVSPAHERTASGHEAEEKRRQSENQAAKPLTPPTESPLPRRQNRTVLEEPKDRS
jgi:hypothetical protein